MTVIVPHPRRRERLNKHIKPEFWAVSPGLVDPKWSWFHNHCVGAFMPFSSDAIAKDGATIYDRSRHQTDGTVDSSSGDISLVTGLNGPVLKFSGDATNDRIDLGSITSADILSFAGKSQMSWVIGLKYDGSPNSSFPRPFDKSTAGNAEDGFGLWYNTAANMIQFRTLDGGTNKEWNYSTTLSAGDRFQLGLSIPSFSAGRYYRNGNPVSTVLGGTRTVFPSSTANMAIGNWNHSTDRMWDGDIEFLYLFDSAAPAGFFRDIYIDPFGPFRMRERYMVIPDAAVATQIGHGRLLSDERNRLVIT